MPPKKPAKVTVPPANEMLALPFRLHCQKRHPRLGFWNKGEHAADHRLHGEHLDHVHRESAKEAYDDEPVAADSGQPDPGSD